MTFYHVPKIPKGSSDSCPTCRYATLSWMCPIIAVILAITGIGMFKLTPEQQAEELAKLDAEGE